nr:hypothetical protein [Tanacetum cinerariifolium]
MNDTDQIISQEKLYEQVIEDAHVTLTSSQKTKSSKQSSSISFDFASKFLILDNVPPVVDEVASMMNVKNHQEESSTQAPSLFTVPEMDILEISTTHTTLLLQQYQYATQTALQSYIKEFEKKAQEERKLYIDVVEKSVKDIIKDEVKSQLPQILPNKVSNFATPVIQSTINESLENVILANFSSKLKSTYKAATSLTEFELKKIILDKIEKSFKSKESKSSSSKGTKPQPKSFVKSTQVEEPVFEAEDIEMQQDQGSEFGYTVDKPDGEAALKSDWFKKQNKPPTLDRAWNTTKSINFRLPQTWISNITVDPNSYRS